MGVSAGGFKALHRILPMFSIKFPVPLIIVQHRSADETSGGYLIKSLDKRCQLQVREAQDKFEIMPGNIYIAPGGYHLLVENEQRLALSLDMPVCYCRPSIDVLFESAADVFGSGLAGVIMTGANFDGSSGIKTIKSAGGVTIAQNPATSDAEYMPMSAIKTGFVDHVLDLDGIPTFLTNLLETK
ncbi:MAG: chemotaxis protein CheB [Desulfamplus sp.]|nr:chemotaxis protein CheB [Desulfamplus sp.]